MGNLTKVKEVEKVFLRGKDTYQELLVSLRECNAPLECEGSFAEFYLREFLVTDDVFALFSTVNENIAEFDCDKPRDIIWLILEEIYNDYVALCEN